MGHLLKPYIFKSNMNYFFTYFIIFEIGVYLLNLGPIMIWLEDFGGSK